MNNHKLLAWLLLPFSIWYAVAIAIRNLMYIIGAKRTVVPPVTTIGVGNLCMGGAGKTPMVDYILALFQDRHDIALLSRGYKRKTKGYLLADEHATIETIGDEPFMLHQKYPNVTTAVCEKRLTGLLELQKTDTPPQLVVLDDVYQHRQIKPTLNILLTEFDRPFFHDSILPFGNLREFKSARDRANIIIVTKSPENLNPLEKHAFISNLQAKPYQKIFFSYLQYGNPTPVSPTVPPLHDLPKHLLLVTGIANPTPLIRHLSSKHQVKHLPFPDHYSFTPQDINHIQEALLALPQGSIVLTTEKDAVRLRQLDLHQLPIYYLPISIRIHQSDDHNLDRLLTSIVRENIEYRSRLHTSPLTSLGDHILTR